MDDEQLIRSEAGRCAYRWGAYQDDYDGHNEFIEYVKQELEKFYSAAHKAVFLDEVTQRIQEVLNKHVEQCTRHREGKPCDREVMLAKVLFFLKQEVAALPMVIHPSEIANPERSSVFISYSHQDRAHLDYIRRHFRPLENRIDFWDDKKIKPGQEWEHEIKQAISKAKVALLLLSADFFNSDFILKKEIPPLLEAARKDGAIILFIVLKPCILDEYPDIMKYQGVNAPSRPFIKMDEADKEELCVNLVMQIRDTLTPRS
ncbi:toll/interleukin-1 receptor domain-containing protein [Hymenobacter sp. BT664]|uniref:Toll/interleukin-1 receptor domain-containing protein n=1 Tax=Hymenobacter montanus TaxID=2771359 RepID=A0A927GKA6_9BACT|nr:toll/interleukin-1 receptor domain-containing protein [Hymenobacter montanus]MBD2769373.1 toll/interleukin-1 receptor domain-containing protein [Hymenobacter montanus]